MIFVKSNYLRSYGAEEEKKETKREKNYFNGIINKKDIKGYNNLKNKRHNTTKTERGKKIKIFNKKNLQRNLKKNEILNSDKNLKEQLNKHSDNIVDITEETPNKYNFLTFDDLNKDNSNSYDTYNESDPKIQKSLFMNTWTGYLVAFGVGFSAIILLTILFCILRAAFVKYQRKKKMKEVSLIKIDQTNLLDTFMDSQNWEDIKVETTSPQFFQGLTHTTDSFSSTEIKQGSIHSTKAEECPINNKPELDNKVSEFEKEILTTERKNKRIVQNSKKKKIKNQKQPKKRNSSLQILLQNDVNSTNEDNSKKALKTNTSKPSTKDVKHNKTTVKEEPTNSSLHKKSNKIKQTRCVRHVSKAENRI